LRLAKIEVLFAREGVRRFASSSRYFIVEPNTPKAATATTATMIHFHLSRSKIVGRSTNSFSSFDPGISVPGLDERFNSTGADLLALRSLLFRDIIYPQKSRGSFCNFCISWEFQELLE